MDDAEQFHPGDYAHEGQPQPVTRRRWSWLKRTFQRPFLITARVLLFSLTTGWAKLWRKRPGSKPPHWAKDLLDLVDLVNLVPTFFVMALAPGHFFRRTKQIRECGSSVYKTPIKFVISAVPFIAGLVGWLYEAGLAGSMSFAFRATLWGFVHVNCCDQRFLDVAMAFRYLREHLYLLHLNDVQIIALVLLGIPVWIALVSGFVALTLVFPYGLVGAAKSLASFLIPLDPKSYLRLRLNDYIWNTVYFAVYFTIAFPFCLLTLYGLYHEALFPTLRLMKFGLLNLWLSATSVAFVASVLIGPYNELLKASVIVPTPLMLQMRLSQIAKLLQTVPIAIQIAQKGNSSPLERTIDSCNRECSGLRTANARLMIRAAKAGDRWKRKLTTDLKKAFSCLRTYELSQAEKLPLSLVCKAQIAFVSDFLLSNGASNLPEVVPPKKPFLRRLGRKVLLILGTALLISTILIFAIWWFVGKG
jgi:hypothetical protein